MTSPEPNDRREPNTSELDAQIGIATVVGHVVQGNYPAAIDAIDTLRKGAGSAAPMPIADPSHLILLSRECVCALLRECRTLKRNHFGPEHINSHCAAALQFANPADVAAELLGCQVNPAPWFLPPAVIERAAAVNRDYEYALSGMSCRPIIRALATHDSPEALADWAATNVTPALLDLIIRDAFALPWWVNAWGIMRGAMLDRHRDGWLTEAINRHGVGPFVHPVHTGPAAHHTNTDVRRTIELACTLGALGTPGSLPLDERLLEGLVGNIRARGSAAAARLRAAKDDEVVKAVLASAKRTEIEQLCAESIMLAYEEAIARQLWLQVIPLGLRATTAKAVGDRFRRAVANDPCLLKRTLARLHELAPGAVHSLPPCIAELAVRMKRLELTWAIARLRLQARPATDGRPLDQAYRTESIPKRDGSMRELLVPEPWLNSLQAAILHEILDPMDGLLHDAAHGFRPGRGTATNAEVHVASSRVVNVDIADFFGSVRLHHVKRALEPLLEQGWGLDTVMLVAQACIARDRLPAGAPTSPAIANHVLRGVDAKIAAICAELGLRYSRYADDLTISAPSWSTIDPVRAIPAIRALLAADGFSLAEHKTCVYGSGSQQLVTGLVTNDHVSVPKRLRRWLRAVRHAMSLGKTPHQNGSPMTPAQVQGWSAYLASIAARRQRNTP